MDDLDRISRAFDMLLRVADSERVHARRQRATAIDLNKTEIRALRVVVELGELTVTELSRLLHVSQPTASRTLAQLERRRLVLKTSDASDGRLTCYQPSDEGRSLWQRFHRHLLVELEAALAFMPDAKRAQFATLLEEMVEGTYLRRPEVGAGAASG